MLIREYRIVMPMTTQEYHIGQLYAICEAQLQQTGGGEGVEVLRNEPFEDGNLFNGEFSSGQYTHKLYHITNRLPAIVRPFVSNNSMIIHEHSWNAFPYSLTKLTNPDWRNFSIRIESIHLNDRGTTENALRQPRDVLSEREIVRIDIANDGEHLNTADIQEATRPSTFRSERTGRGPLVGQWQNKCEPVMCAYKLVTVNVNVLLRPIVEPFAHKQYARLFCKFNREIFCWIDRWHRLTMAQIRDLEERVTAELEEARAQQPARGMNAS